MSLGIKRLSFCIAWAVVSFAVLLPGLAIGQQHVVLQGNERLAIVDPDGKVEWEIPWGGIHDVHVLGNGNFMVQQGKSKIAEINRKSKQVVWSYDSSSENGNAGKQIEVHAFQPLPDDSVMIAESGVGRIIEIDRSGKLLKQFPLKLNSPHYHMDTRLARKLENGHYLVSHEGDGFVREYDGKGKVVWEYEVPLFGRERRDGHGPESFGNKVFGAIRLASGNTLIATGNGHSVLEVTPKSEVVWSVTQNELPGIMLAWVTTLEVLPNGNYLIGNCHAGPENPILIELEPKSKKVVWKLSAYEQFGNNVSNSKSIN